MCARFLRSCFIVPVAKRKRFINAFSSGFRETAFASAIVSAAVVLSVAKSCSAGTLPNCGCDAKIYKNGKQRITAKPPPAYVTANDWKWGGCSHNLKYGIRFSKLFLDSRELAEDIHSIINLHNNQVGRKVSTAECENAVRLFSSPLCLFLIYIYTKYKFIISRVSSAFASSSYTKGRHYASSPVLL